MHSHFYVRVMEYVADLTSILPPILLAGAVYALGRWLWLKKRGQPRGNWGNEGARLLLVCWLSGLLALVWTPGNFWIKLRNFLCWGLPMELGDWLCRGGFSFDFTLHRQFARMLAGGSWQVAGNVLLYLPLGLLLPLVWKEARWWLTAACALALSLVTELVQPVVGRSFDVDDLAANTLGALLGYLLFVLVRLAAPKAVARCQSGKRCGQIT